MEIFSLSLHATHYTAMCAFTVGHVDGGNGREISSIFISGHEHPWLNAIITYVDGSKFTLKYNGPFTAIGFTTQEDSND